MKDKDEFESACEFIALDLETTGLWAAADRIVEIAAVRFRETGATVDTFESLVNPERLVSLGAYAVHGISDQELAGAPRACDVLPELLAFLGDPEYSALVAHNASFDAGFLGSELNRAGLGVPGHAIYDTLALRASGCRCSRIIGSTRSRGISGSIRLGPTARWRTRCS